MKKDRKISEKSIPLPVAKWTTSSLLKLNDSFWATCLKGLLDDDELSKEEKNKRIDTMLVWFKLIEDNCMNGLLTIKKS